MRISTLGSWVLFLLLVLAAAAPGSAASAGAVAFSRAKADLSRFEKDRAKQKFRHNWIGIIAKLDDAAEQQGGTADAAEALFLQAGLWARLHAFSNRASDLNQALATYERVVHKYPRSPWAERALWERSDLFLTKQNNRAAAAREVRDLLARYPSSKLRAQAQALQKRLPQAAPPPAPTEASDGPDPKLFGRSDERGPTPQVSSIRTWSNPVYSRVALTLSAPAEARLGELREDPATKSPPRIFVDIANASLSNGIKPELPIEDELLQRVRVAQRPDGKVRVVLDLKQPARPRVLVMENPFRLVIDALVGEEATAPEPTLQKMTRRKRVVIDPGHGGHDSGAIGPGGAREKDVVLAIGKQLQRMLEVSGVETHMTRSDDTFISLEERTAIANGKQADAFVSVHANSATHGRAHGIETYYLNVTSDRYAIRLAAVENKTSEEQVTDLQLILADLSTKANSVQSIGLARQVQKRMVLAARPLNPQTKDLGVKASLFYVLLGARMPAILAETSFISNLREAKLLTSEAYQTSLARAIAEAVTEHLKAPVQMSESEKPGTDVFAGARID